MDAGHAAALVRAKEISARAHKDYKEKTVSSNPYPSHWHDTETYKRLVKIYTCRDQHQPLTECCIEHDQHLGRRRMYQWGVGSCEKCETRVEPLRKENKQKREQERKNK